MKQVMGATVTRFLRPVTYRRDSAAPAGNTMDRVLRVHRMLVRAM